MGWCIAGGTFSTANGFTDIGFKATGNVMYIYGVDATTVAAPGLLYAGQLSCLFVPRCYWDCSLLGVLGNNNFVAVAKSNLDGDANVSTWASTQDHGATDCTTGGVLGLVSRSRGPGSHSMTAGTFRFTHPAGVSSHGGLNSRISSQRADRESASARRRAILLLACVGWLHGELTERQDRTVATDRKSRAASQGRISETSLCSATTT